MKIAELAKRAGVSRETIHFYVRQGLLPRPVKAGQTVAFYSDEHLERLLLVRRLREEKFLPLSVIRRLLESGRVRPGAQDIELLSEISQMSPTDETEDRPAASLARTLGIDASVLARAGELGLVDPHGQLGPGDRRVLVAIAETMHLPPAAREAALTGMRACREHVDRMVASEANLFFASLLREQDATEAVAALVGSRPAVAHFVAAYRARCLHALIDRTLAEVDAGVEVASHSATRPLSASAREAGGYDALRTKREAAAHAPGASTEAQLALLRLHFGVGDPVALEVELERVSGRLADDPRVLLFAGVARADRRDLTRGLALMARAVERAPDWALVRAMHGATLLRGLASRDGTAPSGSVLVDGTRGIAEMDRAAALRSAPEDEPWVRYLWARVALMLPTGFGRADEARAVLVRMADEALPSTDLERVRLRGNARLALGLDTNDVTP